MTGVNFALIYGNIYMKQLFHAYSTPDSFVRLGIAPLPCGRMRL
jgi:hypothetical protein